MMKVLGFEINSGDIDSITQVHPALTRTRQID